MAAPTFEMNLIMHRATTVRIECEWKRGKGSTQRLKIKDWEQSIATAGLDKRPSHGSRYIYLTKFPFFRNKALLHRAKRNPALAPSQRLVDEPTFVHEARLALGEEKWQKLIAVVDARKNADEPEAKTAENQAEAEETEAVASP